MKNSSTDTPPNPPLDYKIFLYDKNDTFDMLKLKNENLRNLVIQANDKINLLIKQKNELENEYQIEKKTILQHLEKISQNYKIYANSHKSLKTTEVRMNEFINENQRLLQLNDKVNKSLDQLTNTFYSIYTNIDEFLKKSSEDHIDFNNSMEVFQYLLSLRNKILDDYNQIKKADPKKNSTKPSRPQSTTKKKSITPNSSSRKLCPTKSRGNVSLNSNSKKNIESARNSYYNTYRTKFVNGGNENQNKLELNDKVYSDFNCQVFSN